jgi:hypothetical protein
VEGKMEKRSPIAVFLLPLVTFGIYGLVWFYKTKEEMVSKGAEIPTFILVFIPIISLFWLWKYCLGVEKVTGGETSAAVAFLLLFFLGTIGMALLQSNFNKVS